jgi:type I restriction enzyme, S subunit
MTLKDITQDCGLFCDGDWIETKDQDPNGNVRLIQLADIGDGFFKDKSARFITEEKAAELNCTFLQKGDILIARLPDPLGRACIFPYDGKFITAVDVAILRIKNENISSQYVMHMVNSHMFRKQIKKYESGTTRKRISRKNLEKIEFEIPPLDEQARIVARIEELFSELDNGVQTLQTIKQQLAVYRQAVLKEAFERVDADEITLSAVCDFITKGTTPKKEDMSPGSGDIPYIKVYNLTFNTRLDFSINPTFVSKETHHNFLGRSITMPGDVLMNIVGPPLGKVSIVPDSYPEWNINQAIVRFRCLDKIYNKFLAYYLSFSETVDRMKAKAKATAGQQNLTLEICRCITIPLPSIEVQHQMVDEIESRLSVCDSIEKTVDTALTQAEAMRQSILKKAFEGGLV